MKRWIPGTHPRGTVRRPIAATTTAAIIAALLSVVAASPAVAALAGDVYAAGVTYTASTYSGHPNQSGWGAAVDINDTTGDCGKPVYAPQDGTVTQTSFNTTPGTGYGNALVWTSTDGNEQLFIAHLRDNGLVTGTVSGGAQIGEAGATGSTSSSTSFDTCDGEPGAHLHLEAKRNGAATTVQLSGNNITPGNTYTSTGPVNAPPPDTDGDNVPDSSDRCDFDPGLPPDGCPGRGTDFDSDFDSDVFMYGSGADPDRLLRSNGDLTFTPLTPGDVNGVYAPVAGDFDADGDDDILWYGPGALPDRIWRSNGNNTFTSIVPTAINGTYTPVTRNPPDTDGDGITEVVDNCPDDANADQSDVDGDGIGDACDPTDDRYRIRPYGVVVTEGDTGSQVVDAIVYLDDENGNPVVATEAVSFDWFTGDIPANPNVAHPGTDFVAASGTATFNVGESQTTIPIEIIGDLDDEPPLLYGEWGLFGVNNPSTNAVIDTQTFFGIGLFIIIDND